MKNSSLSLRRFGRILKRTSLEMRRVTSSPMPDFSDVPQEEALPLPLEISGCLYDGRQEGPMDQPQIEFSLNEELIAGMEAIVNCRLCTNSTLNKISIGDLREGIFSNFGI